MCGNADRFAGVDEGSGVTGDQVQAPGWLCLLQAGHQIQKGAFSAADLGSGVEENDAHLWCDVGLPPRLRLRRSHPSFSRRGIRCSPTRFLLTYGFVPTTVLYQLQVSTTYSLFALGFFGVT